MSSPNIKCVSNEYVSIVVTCIFFNYLCDENHQFFEGGSLEIIEFEGVGHWLKHRLKPCTVLPMLMFILLHFRSAVKKVILMMVQIKALDMAENFKIES